MNKLYVFIADMKRALKEPAFFISLTLSIAVLFGALIYFLASGNYDSNDMLFKKSQALIFPFCAALLCTIPYSSMQMLEDFTGYKILMAIKMRRVGYVLPRFFVCGFIGAISLFIPQILLVVTVIILTGDISVLQDCIAGIALSMPFGFAFSTFAYSLTFYNRKRYIPVIFPQVIYMLCIYAFPHLKLSNYYPPLAISPWISNSVSYPHMMVMLGIIMLFSAALTIIGAVHGERKATQTI